MQKKMSDKTLSKFLSLVLRHKPETIGIELDNQGFCVLDELVEKSRYIDACFTKEDVLRVVRSNDKKRFGLFHETSKGVLYIRAVQGHSVKVELDIPEVVPPEFLFHGTAQRFVESIESTGLESRGRNHVHMSKDIDTATAVGRRHGKLAMFKVEAKRMYDRGYKFWKSENGVWLTTLVPCTFLIKQNNG